MTTNGANNKNVAVRDERGRWLKGFSGGPGRPLGTRNKLTEDFLGDIHAAWLSHGQEVLDRIIVEQPEVFFLAMVKLAQVHRVELGQPSAFDRPSKREEVLQLLEKRVGPAGRKMFEDFLVKVEKLEADQEAG